MKASLPFIVSGITLAIGFIFGMAIQSTWFANGRTSKIWRSPNFVMSLQPSDARVENSSREAWKAIDEHSLDTETTFISAPMVRAQDQVDELQRLLNIQGYVRAMVIDPMDEDLVVPLIKGASKRGIPVVTYRHDSPKSPRVTCVRPETDKAAVAALNAAFAGTRPRGKALIVIDSPDDELHRMRSEGFRRYIEEHDDFTIAGFVEDLTEEPEAMERLKNVMTEHTDLQNIFCCDPDTTILVIRAIQDLKWRPNKVTVVGWGHSVEIRRHIREGRLAAVVADRERFMTHLCFTILYSYSQLCLWSGKDPPVPTALIPTLIEVPGFIITAENVGLYEKQTVWD